MTDQPTPWLNRFAYLQLAYGLPLLALGLLLCLDDGDRWHRLSSVGFPFFSLAASHLSLAWTWVRRSPWFWLPHVAALVAWPCTPLWMWLVPHTPFTSRGHVGAIGIGAVPVHVLLIVLLAAAVVFCLYLLQCFAFILAVARRRGMFGHPPSTRRYSLGILMVLGAIIPAAIGLDWGVPAKRMRDEARQNRERVREKQHGDSELQAASLRAVNEYIAAVLSGDDTASAAKLAKCRTAEHFLPTLRHPDARVRKVSVHDLASRPRGSLGELETAALLAVLEDETEQEFIRREALRAICANGEFFKPKNFYEVLAQVAKAHPFVVAELRAMISESSPKNPGPIVYPSIEPVHALESLGPDAVDAIPALIDALDHPDQWTFAVAAADALGSIGPAAEPAIPALQRKAAQHDHLKLREAAQRAIELIRVGPSTEARVQEIP